ncbi:LysR family transcriptional regulator [Marinomonas sp. A79]|uniref:LysR family transcriptional regulator n=1 Tax=Marinomonas vulgaris TaxID=2823372 RepID=A0ABS5HFL4_9GAMM|nr:LysR family transcriptional regulator [Marinomonas vulgaris]MBR7890280.1 LysR family transcriptional regulator [Marinomonas vulgaris]
MSSSKEKLLRNLDWNLIYTFLIIVNEGGISAAARKLNLSQPSVSNALKRLEEHFGKRLILRKKGVFALTLQGMRIYEYASSAGRMLSNMADHFVEQQDTVQGEIVIEVASYLQCPAFDKAIASYHALYPNVIFCINTQPSADIVSHVAEGGLRIGLSNKKISKTGLRFDFIGYEKMAFYCGSSHPFFNKTDLTLDDVKGSSYLSFESDQPGEGLDVIAQFREGHQFWGRLVAVSSNVEEIRRLIMTGIGIGALTTDSAQTYVDQGLLWPLPPYDDFPMTEIYLVTPETVTLNDIERNFIKQLKKHVREDAKAIYK